MRARWVIAAIVVSRGAFAEPPATDPPSATIGDHEITEIAGCWQTRPARISGKLQPDERWTFRAKGTHGLEIVREVPEVASLYNDRVRIPRDVLYRASDRTFGFGAAGRIHRAMFTFTVEGDHLVARSYWQPERTTGYVPNVETFTLRRCTHASG